jgi:nicotinate phosphoribosyltransferase
VFRERDAPGKAVRDHITLTDERGPGERLLVEIMREGRRMAELPALTAAREYCRNEIARLPDAALLLEEGAADYPVQVSAEIEALAKRLDAASA